MLCLVECQYRLYLRPIPELNDDHTNVFRSTFEMLSKPLAQSRTRRMRNHDDYHQIFWEGGPFTERERKKERVIINYVLHLKCDKKKRKEKKRKEKKRKEKKRKKE